MPTRFVAAIAACLLFAAPALAAESCMTWEDGVRTAAEWSTEHDDRVAAILLTPEESAATWAILTHGKPGPARFGVMISQSDPDKAFVAGFDDRGCLIDSGTVSLGPVIDAMVAAGVQSEFVVVKPVAVEPKGEDA